MYILPLFKELLEPNRGFTLIDDSIVRDLDVRDSFVRDFDVRDGPKRLRTLRHLWYCPPRLPCFGYRLVGTAGVDLTNRVCLMPRLKIVWSYTSILLHTFMS